MPFLCHAASELFRKEFSVSSLHMHSHNDDDDCYQEHDTEQDQSGDDRRSNGVIRIIGNKRVYALPDRKRKVPHRKRILRKNINAVLLGKLQGAA